jgi:DNA-binding CsgD family transcriptional regulator
MTESTDTAADPPRDARELLARWTRAYNAHDIDGLIELADPEIQIVPLGYTAVAPLGTRYHGHAGVRSLLEPGFQRYPRLQMRITDETSVGISVVATVTMILDDGELSPARVSGAAVFGTEKGRMRMIRTFTTREEARLAAARGAGALTSREHEILALLAKGLTANEIAARLFLSVLTVRTHIRNAKEKLGAQTLPHAVAIAVQERGSS